MTDEKSKIHGRLFRTAQSRSKFMKPEAYAIWKSSLRRKIQNCKYKTSSRALESVFANEGP